MKYIKCNLAGNTIVEMAIPSRRKYVFSPENSTLPIDEQNSFAEGSIHREDVPDLLSKRREYRACCMGDDVDLNIFVEV